MSCLDVFRLTSGIYIVHAFYFHPEDAEFFDEQRICDTEPIHHYVVYNAGTRVLNLLSEVRPCFVLRLSYDLNTR